MSSKKQKREIQKFSFLPQVQNNHTRGKIILRKLYSKVQEMNKNRKVLRRKFFKHVRKFALLIEAFFFLAAYWITLMILSLQLKFNKLNDKWFSQKCSFILIIIFRNVPYK